MKFKIIVTIYLLLTTYISCLFVKLLIEKNLFIMAVEIDNFYKNIGVATSVKDVYLILKFAKKYQTNIFNFKDLVAISMVESNLNPKARGLKGEVGAYQILDYKRFNCKNPFDIEENTKMAISILTEKYKTYNDKSKAIIAYNGFKLSENGVIIKNYWYRYLDKLFMLEDILKGVKYGKINNSSY